jgi:hypothetical protein
MGGSAPSGWSVRGSNQSLAALATRLHGGTLLLAALDVAAILLAVVALRRRRAGGQAFAEVAVVTVLAVLLSPIAWVHYFLLLFPAWLVALRKPAVGGPWRVLCPVAAVCTSGLLTVWSLAARKTLLELSIYTWGALLLLAALAFLPTAERTGPRPC